MAFWICRLESLGMILWFPMQTLAMFWMKLDSMGLIHHRIPFHSHHQLLMVM